jgi:hypothetical protein
MPAVVQGSAVVLPYNRDNSFTTQEYFWDCGPASGQLCLNVQGQNVSEQDLIVAMGTDQGGTDSIDQVAAGLNQFDPAGAYQSLWLPTDPATPQQVDAMRSAIFRTIRSGRGCVANFVVPPSNYPKPVSKADKSLPGADAPPPSYGPGQIWHYVSVLGCDESDDTALIVDPGFQPAEFWVTIPALASYVTPHGVVFSSAAPELPAAPPAAPAPPAGPAGDGVSCIIGRNGPKPYPTADQAVQVATTAHEVTMWLPGRTMRDGLGDFLTNPARVDTSFGHSINAASLARVNHEILVRLAAKLGVDISDVI